MQLSGKKIWVDIEHQKAGIMFKSLFKHLSDEGADLFITARDMGNNRQVMDELGLNYRMVGKHGGEKLEDKMHAYIERLQRLFPLITAYMPDFFLTFGSVEGIRLAFGLRIPSLSFNDEPRSTAVGRLTLPIVDTVITPKCVPVDQYLNLGASNDRIVRYDGIDEIAWIAEFKPKPDILDMMDVKKGEYVLMRTEMTHTEYLANKMRPEESYITQFLPAIFKEFPNHKYFIIPRLDKQFEYLQKKLKALDPKHVIVTKYIPRVQDFMFYSALVASGGGTIVRESSLLDIPSIEFFPGETAPQEHFLMENNFPLWHIKDFNMVARKAIEILASPPGANRFTDAFKEKLKKYENPNDVCYNLIAGRLQSR
jgi:predicted glycosyltransferase